MVKTAYKVSISGFKGSIMSNAQTARYNLTKTIGVDMRQKQNEADSEMFR